MSNALLFAVRERAAQRKDKRTAIEFAPTAAVMAIRIDPSRGPGKIQISAARLADKTGKTVHQWDF